jgi:type 1 glutamine amidotransferase
VTVEREGFSRARPTTSTNVGRSAEAFALLALILSAGIVVTHAATGHLGAQPSKPLHIAFVTGDDEYRSEITMPMVAAILEKVHGFRTSIAYARPRPQSKDNIEGLEALETADLMVIFTRFRQLPDDQVKRILDFTESGKPMIGLRTTTHAFQYPEGSPHRHLNDGFGRDIFGQKWIVHHGHRSSTQVTIHDGSQRHPILRGIQPFRARSWLYHVAPLQGSDNTVLLDGTSIDSERLNRASEFPLTQPVAWTRHYKSARVFFTTLGHPEDFAQESMRRLLINAVYWALGRDVPAGGANATVQGTYEPPETFDLSKAR